MPYCSNCGYKIAEKDRFCYQCGKQILNQPLSIFDNPATTNVHGKMDAIKQPQFEAFSGMKNSELGKKDVERSITETEILSLPYSWIFHDVEISLLGLAKTEGYEYGIPHDNKKQYNVAIKFRNLLNTSNKVHGGNIGFESLKLKTDVGNIWDLKYNINSVILSETLDPQEEFIRNEAMFEIRNKEIPEFLLAEIFNKKYTFNVKMITIQRYKESNERYQLR